MPTVPPQFTQSPGDVLDYPVDWIQALAPGEEISSADFTVPSGLTKVAEQHTTTNATVWLTGGELDQPAYLVTCVVTTTQARTYDRSFYMKIVQR